MEVYIRGDVSIKFRTRGSGTISVLLLHGFPDSSNVWDKQVSNTVHFSTPNLPKTRECIP